MVGTISGVSINKRGQDHDVTLFKGTTVNFSIVWGGSTPIDVTGFSAKLQIRSKASDASPAFEFTTSNSRVTIGTTDGVITFSMTSTDTAALTAGKYVYMMVVTDASGSTYPVMTGRFIVESGVS